MTLTNRILRSSLVVPAAAGLLVSGSAQAQMPYGLRPLTPATHVTFDGYYTQYRLDARGDDRIAMDGMGARITWRPASVDLDAPVLPSRLAFGLFAEHAPEQSTGFSITHAGLQSDVNLVASPWRGRVIPVLSLGAGALWTRTAEGTSRVVLGPVLNARRSADFPLAARNTTTFALSPALGARVGLWRQLGLRADVRDMVTFRDRTLHNLQFAAGLSYPF